MSQTQGDVSGARPTQEYSGCEHSLTHITLGAGGTYQQYLQPQQHHYPPQQVYQDHSQTHQQQQSQPQGDSRSHGTASQQLPAGAGLVFGGRANPTPLYGNNRNNPNSVVNTATNSNTQPGVGFGGETSNRFGRPSPAPLLAGDSQPSPQDFLLPPQVYDNSNMLREQEDPDDNGVDDPEDRDGGDFDDGADGNSQGSGKRSRTRRPHLQGRFSGRLTTKEDERRLAEECKLLGPLLGGVGKRGDKSRLTLAKIVRGIATGDVRRFCEERERAIGMLKAKLAAIDPDAAASVPVNPIALPSGAMMGGGMGSLGGPMGNLGPTSSGMSMGLGLGMNALGMGGHSRQLEALQRENSELQREMHNLRLELQARERLLLELQDTGIISGFVPTSISLDEPSRMLSHHHTHSQGGPMGGVAGGGGGGGGRAHSADMQPVPYGLPPRHQSYSQQQQQQHAGSYGGPSQMSIPQSSAHVSGGMEPSPMGGPMVLSHPMPQQQQQQPQLGLQPGGGPGLATADSVSMGLSMPAMSEHSRAGRPMKRPAVADLGPGGGGGADGGAYGEVARSLSHPPLGRGGGGSGGFAHVDLQQQLNSLQAQVEHLQNLSQAHGSRSAGSYLMPARERVGMQQRMPPGGGAGSGMQYGGGGAGGGTGAGGGGGPVGASPFMSSHSGGQGGGLMMLPSHHTPQPDSGSHPYHAHPGIGAPLQLQQVVKPDMYDDVGGVVGGRNPRDGVGVGGRHAGGADGHGPYGGGVGGSALDATLEHMINSRAMRGEYDLPLELLLPEGAGKGGGAVPGPH